MLDLTQAVRIVLPGSKICAYGLSTRLCELLHHPIRLPLLYKRDFNPTLPIPFFLSLLRDPGRHERPASFTLPGRVAVSSGPSSPPKAFPDVLLSTLGKGHLRCV